MQKPTSLIIAANFTAEPVRAVLSYLLRTVGIDATISFAPHHQVTIQLLDPSSDLSRNDDGVNVLLLNLNTVLTAADNLSTGTSVGDVMLTQLIDAIELRTRSATSLWVVVSCPPPPRVLEHAHASETWRAAEKRLKEALRSVSGVEVVGADDILSPYSLHDYYDEYANLHAEIAYKAVFFAALSVVVARRIHACVRPPRKVLVVDCDNTLWLGICAEDGPQAVKVDASRRDLQEFLVELCDRGILLCLCSKNNEVDVWDVFEQCPDMVVRRDSIVSWRINWLPKYENMRSLADELQVGLDTVVFIDDDPMECAEMRAHLPEVVTVHCPVKSDVRQLLRNLWVFDQATVTAEDRLRTSYYQQSDKRERVRATATTIEQFVKMLDVRVTIRPAGDSDLGRLAQLTSRVTQCNYTLKCRSEHEMLQVLRHNDYRVLAIHVSDCYGDYGLVGVVIVHLDGELLNVDTFLLSCRALGRNIERQMIQEIERLARVHNRTAVRLHFVTGPRNGRAKAFLDNLEPPWTHRSFEGTCEYLLPLSPLPNAFN